jgi:hypothetical protein
VTITRSPPGSGWRRTSKRELARRRAPHPAGLAMTKAASKDLGGHNIRVNALLVGLVATSTEVA